MRLSRFICLSVCVSGITKKVVNGFECVSDAAELASCREYMIRMIRVCVCVLNVFLSSCHHSLCIYVCYVYLNKDQSINE